MSWFRCRQHLDLDLRTVTHSMAETSSSRDLLVPVDDTEVQGNSVQRVCLAKGQDVPKPATAIILAGERESVGVGTGTHT